MISNKIYGFLESPSIYRLSQKIFAPGAEKGLAEIVKHAVGELSLPGRSLDVGCGPNSWLTKAGIKPFGLDISYSYSLAYQQTGPATTASAMELPFKSSSFDNVWSIGVLHHLPDDAANQAIQEMLRVCKSGGDVIFMDAVLPLSLWRRPLACLVRKLDRGKFMRSQEELESLLPEKFKWNCKRRTYAFNGLEILVCQRRLMESYDNLRKTEI